MKEMSLVKQIIVLSLLSLVLGLANNLRPEIAIQWVRDWPVYSEVMEKNLAPESEKTETGAIAAAESAPVSEAERAEKTMSMLFGNAQVTDIGLQEALNLYTFAKEETLWIDARDAELFAEGHIEGSVLCYLYEKNTYLPELENTIAERQPTALVVYCKGADCTDSHVLAEDLYAMGHTNIFVYTGGFNEWYQAGHPIGGALAESTSQSADLAATSESTPAEGDFDAAAAEASMNLLFENAGQVSDINLETAYNLFRYAEAETLWIDARDAKLFAEGHITGSVLCYLYEKNTYLPELENTIAERAPTALIVYCKGADCTDSHVLAQDLFAMGHSNIFVYTGGFNEWYQAGYPIEGTLAEQEAAGTTDVAQAKPKPRELEIKPKGMYLEHVLRDLIPFFFGMMLIIGWRYFSTRDLWIIISSMFVGGFFIWAAWSKIENPFLFAKAIWNYDIVPGQIINISALWLPMLELLAGVCLIFGFLRKGSSTIISGLLIVFIVAVSYNVLRGHEFDCGCTATGTMLTDLYLEGWDSKYLLLLRDVGLLAMSVIGFSMAKSTKQT
jgi:rhodanese-related sulfurtransferase/uncharacterized membrane protein YphA (DoxX/SURF4 family)